MGRRQKQEGGLHLQKLLNTEPRGQGAKRYVSFAGVSTLPTAVCWKPCPLLLLLRRRRRQRLLHLLLLRPAGQQQLPEALLQLAGGCLEVTALATVTAWPVCVLPPG